MKVSLLVYTMNEIDGMKAVMPRVRPEWCDEIVVIDGGSTDGTVEYAEKMGYKVYRQAEPTFLGAYKEGHRRAEGDVIIDFSPDGNSVPEAIPALIEKIREGYDLVLASRYAPGAKSEDDTFITRIGNFMFTAIINLLFGGHYTDTLVIYRAYRKSVLKDCGLDRDLDYAFTPQLCIRCAKFGKKVAEVPADEPKRLGGVQKMQVLRDGMAAVRIILKELMGPWPGRKGGA